MISFHWQKILHTIQSEWKRIRYAKSNVVFGVDLDGNELRVIRLQLSGDEHYHVDMMQTILLERDENGNVLQQVKQKLQEMKLETGKVVTLIPRDQVNLAQLTLPTSDPVLLQKMAPYEAAKRLPYDADELIADVSVIRNTEDGHTDVWLTSIHRDQLQSNLDVLSELDIEPDQIDISIFCLSRFQQLQETADSLVCFIGNKRLDILHQDQTTILYQRGINRSIFNGNQNILEEEVTKTFQQMEQTNLISSSSIIQFVSNDSHDVSMLNRVQDRYSYQPVSLPDRIQLDQDVDPSAYMEAIGAALPLQPAIDLIPQALQSRKRIRQRVLEWIFTLGICVLMLILSIVLTDRYIVSVEQHLAEISIEARELTREARDLRRLNNRIEAVATHISQESSPLEIYSHIYQLIPDSIAVNHLQYNRGILNLKGQTNDYGQVWQLMDLFSEKDLFDTVQMTSASSRSVRNQTVIDFSLQITLSQTEE